MKPVQTFGAALMASALFLAVPGCERQGPAEQVGERIDNAAEKAGDKLEKAGEAIKESVQDNHNSQ